MTSLQQSAKHEEDVENGPFTCVSLQPMPQTPSSVATSRTVSSSEVELKGGHLFPPQSILSPTETLVDVQEPKTFSKPCLSISEAAMIPLPKIAKGEMPKKKRPTTKWIRFRIWFSTYRKFFTLIIFLNCVGVAMTLSGRFSYALEYPGALVLGNLLMAILMRNELFGRFLYLSINTLFAKWTPLWWRLGCTSTLQHLGGIHSGCATSGCLWLIVNVIDNFRNHSQNHDAVLVLGVLTNLAVIISIISAFPWVRNTHHNVFERHHRFIGWVGLACTWVFVILGNIYDPKDSTFEPNAMRLIGSQAFWFAFGMTVFVILPWCCTRQVTVDIEIPSPKVAIVRFERGMQQGLLGRIARSSIMEYHAFGIISEGTHAKYHYMICGVQGDFTRSLVRDPPLHLWTRELKFAGVSNTSNLYKRGIRICTGTGLGAALSTCLQSPNWFLIWIGSEQEQTFGPTISSLIRNNIEPERMILWDSRARGGRPDTMKLLKEVYRYWRAEVVFITSNFEGNQEMMEGCKEAGIPAFGTLWDF